MFATREQKGGLFSFGSASCALVSICTPYIAMLICYQLYWELSDNGILTTSKMPVLEVDTEYVESIDVYALLGMVRNERE